MSIEFVVSELIPASPEIIYFAWLDSGEHTKMTGSPARASNKVGEQFSAWDGYIQGKNLELVSSNRIIQTWRTTEFDESDPDSHLEITFEAMENFTRVTIQHSNLPSHGMQYQQGWIEAYFIPMMEHFKEYSISQG